jgi:hypothetical protein
VANQSTNSSTSIYNANNGSKSVESRRDYRYGRRTKLWSITSLPRVHKCGKTPIGAVQIQVKDGVAFTRNLTTCGSVWVCPVCSAKVLAKRQLEIADAITAWQKRNGYFVFHTITLPHPKGANVARQRLGLKTAWDAINKGRFSALNKTYGQAGYLKVIECSSGDCGFHLHLHVIRFTTRWLTSNEVLDWSESLFNQMSKALVKKGFRAPNIKAQAFDQVEITAEWSGYFAKSFDNPVDAASSTENVSRDHSVWRLLDKAIATPKSIYTRLWNDYEKGTHNLRQMTWSQGFRRELGLAEDETDTEISEEPESQPQAVLEVNHEDVHTFVHLGHLHSKILHHIGNGDIEIALGILNEHGIRYTLLTPLLDHEHPIST